MVTSNVDELPGVFHVFVDPVHVLAEHNVGRLGHLSSATLSFVSTDPQLWEEYLKDDLDYRPWISEEGEWRLNPDNQRTISPYIVDAAKKGRYPMELAGEEVRKIHAPEAPSRLSAVYVFGDRETCRVASQTHGWDMNQLTPFTLGPTPGTKVWRANMEIVSLLNSLAEAGELDAQTTRTLWSAYWKGSDGTGVVAEKGQPLVEKVLWEFLIEGTLQKV